MCALVTLGSDAVPLYINDPLSLWAPLCVSSPLVTSHSLVTGTQAAQSHRQQIMYFIYGLRGGRHTGQALGGCLSFLHPGSSENQSVWLARHAKQNSGYFHHCSQLEFNRICKETVPDRAGKDPTFITHPY